MRTKITCLFLFIFSIHFIYANSTSSNERKTELLSYVKKSPKTSNIDLLTKYLSKAPKNDMEKAEIIYLWLTENIAYDAKNFQKRKYLSQDAHTTLRNKKAVCGGYAKLFKAMGDKLNLPVRVVSGFSKGYGYIPGRKFTRSSHAWNIVTVEGKEILIDATWGAGYVKSHSGNLKFTKRLSYYWFNTKPSEFVFSHFPKNKPKDQLLTKSLTVGEFEKLPQINKAFFKNRIGNSDKIITEFKEGVKHSIPKVYNLPIRISVVKAPLEMKRKGKYLFQFYIPKGQKVAIIHNKKFLKILEKDDKNFVRFLFSPEKRGKHKISIQHALSKNQRYATFIEYEVAY